MLLDIYLLVDYNLLKGKKGCFIYVRLYLRALPGRKPAGSPVNPLENIPSSLKKQLEGIAPAMGEQFNQEFLRQLRLVLTRTELKSYRDGFQTGAQLMLSMLEDCCS